MIKLFKNKYLILNLFLVISIIISLNFKSFKKHIYVSLKKDEYKELMFKCDNAMRDHFIAKQIFDKAPNSDNLKELEASEVGLMDCHDYDKLRKKLIIAGLSSEEMSLIGLEAIEQKTENIKAFVDIHEIRY